MLLTTCRFRPALAALAAWFGAAALAAAQDVPYIAKQVAPPPVLIEEEEEEGDVLETSEVLFQPTPPDATTQPERRGATDLGSRRGAASTARRPGQRLASVPNMFGDQGAGGAVLTTRFLGRNNAGGPPPIVTASSMIVAPGGGRRSKISEQNKALPDDRVYMFYNHFENAIINTNVNGGQQLAPIDRYTFGVEKTFFNGVTSLEIRMPFSNAYNFNADPANPANFNVSGANTGNLVFIPKLLMLQSPETIVAGGLGIETPTGADVSGQMNGRAFTFHNDSVHLSPYMAFLHQSTERLFWLGFAQIDMPLNSNRVSLFNAAGTRTYLGSYTEQNFVYLDLAGGYSFYVNPEARWLNLLAFQGELHYGGATNIADRVVGTLDGINLDLAPPASRIQMVNATFALTGIVSQNTFLRIGGTAPLRDFPNRFFDSELQAAVIQRY